MARSRLLIALAAIVASLIVQPLRAETIATIPVGSLPFGVAADSGLGRVFVANLGSANVSVIDSATSTEIKRIPVGDSPLDVAVNPSTHRAYVVTNSAGPISVINTSTLDVIATIPSGLYAASVDVNPVTNRVYIGTNSGIAVIDGVSNQVMQTISNGCAHRVAVDQQRNRIYYTGGSGRYGCPVSYLDGSTHQSFVAFSTDGSTTNTSLEVDRASGRVYVGEYVFPYFHRRLRVWSATGGHERTFALNFYANGIAIDSQAKRVYLSGEDPSGSASSMRVLDTAHDIFLDAPTPTLRSRAIAVDPGSRRVFIPDYDGASLVVFEDDIVATAPSAPRDLIATVEPRAGEIRLQWSAPLSSGSTTITGYRIYRGRSSGSETYLADSSSTTYVDANLPPSTEFFYTVTAWNGVGEGPASNEASAVTLRVPSAECVAGTAVFDGAVASPGWDGLAMRLRLLSTESSSAVCFRVEHNVVTPEYGAKITVTPSNGAAPSVDESSEACATTPGNESVLAPVTGHLGDPAGPALRYEIRFFSRSDLGTWLCVRAWNGDASVSRRIVFGSTSVVRLEVDPPPSGSAHPQPASTGSASGLCRANDGDELFTTETADGSRVWLTSWNESWTRVHLCVRHQGANGSVGGRLTFDTTSFLAATVMLPYSAYCPNTVLGDPSDPFHVGYSDPGNPTYVCVNYSVYESGILGINWRTYSLYVGVMGPSGPPEITWTPDA